MCNKVGVPLVEDKTVGPLTELDFVGIELDSRNMEARLPPDKIQKCTRLLDQFLGMEKATLRELQSLIGLLNFAVCVVPPGRPFLRRLINLTIGLKHHSHRRRITKEVKMDLSMWLEFLSGFNGRCFFLSDRFYSSDTLHLFSDSSTTIGFEVVFGTHWAYGVWEEQYRSLNIAILEFYPIVLALYLWSKELSNKVIVFHTDNEALVHVINKQSAKEPTILSILRRIGEITTRSARLTSLLERSDLQVDLASPSAGMSVVFRKYKHSKGSRPVVIQISPQDQKLLCPVVNMCNYLSVRPDTSGVVFPKPSLA
ncbi:uncharacterized protein LOC135486748 [Lineus longissimus]|uniref:uncharacterized protein LOC135486748 n=1 Tax=Lineus longissimus TaxID=88925 RepID=UPI00315C90AD